VDLPEPTLTPTPNQDTLLLDSILNQVIQIVCLITHLILIVIQPLHQAILLLLQAILLLLQAILLLILATPLQRQDIPPQHRDIPLRHQGIQHRIRNIRHSFQELPTLILIRIHRVLQDTLLPLQGIPLRFQDILLLIRPIHRTTTLKQLRQLRATPIPFTRLFQRIPTNTVINIRTISITSSSSMQGSNINTYRRCCLQSNKWVSFQPLHAIQI